MPQFKIISYTIWNISLLLALFLFAGTLHFVPSLILFIATFLITIFGLLYTKKNRLIYIFSPIFQTCYAILFYCNIIGLYYFSKYNFITFFELPNKSESFFITVSILYFLFEIITLIPYFFQVFSKKRTFINLKILNNNFIISRVKKYLILSQIILIIMLFLIFTLTGYTPISAFFNLLDFRHSYNSGIANYVFVFFNFMLTMHLLLLLKYLIINKNRSKFFIISAIIFGIFYLFWICVSGARGTILTFFVYLIYIVASKKTLKVNIKLVFLLTILFFSVCFLMSSLFYLRNQQTNRIYSIAEKRSILYESINRIDGFSNSVRFFLYLDETYDSIIDYNDIKIGKQIVGQLSNFIPRSILPEKSYPISGELTKIIFPETFYNNINIVFGGISNTYYTYGILGILIEPLFIGFIIATLQFYFKKMINKDVFFINYFCWGINIPIRFFQIGILNTAISNVMIINIILSLIITLYLAKKLPRFNRKLQKCNTIK